MGKTVQLPSGRVVTLEPRADLTPHARQSGAPLFSEAVALFREGDVALRERGEASDVGTFELQDFHALRAIATRLGWLTEASVELPCRNCGEVLTVAPCAGLPLGPFEDRELHDPELDRTLPLTSPHPIPKVRVGRSVARDVTLEPRTVDQAAPLHRALRRRSVTLTPSLVGAMGVASLGPERDPARIAAALAACSEKAWGTITDLFLEAHYPPRLFSITVCPHCKARNDVDAPYEREFEPSGNPRMNADSMLRGHSLLSGETNAQHCPSFEEFDARARAIARELIDDPSVVLVVEGGVPACDDGGEPLLGSYVPSYEGDMTAPSRAPEITVYFRTFQALWAEEGPYDWEAELRETVEHELEHHDYHLAGGDPMDEAERDAIDQEAARVLGKKAIVRGQVTGLAIDFAGFIRKTWPIWLLLLAATVLAAISSR